MKPSSFLVATALPLLVALQAKAGIESFKRTTAQPRLYQKTEWDITLKESWQDPYLVSDLALDMILLSPSGRTLSLPCYFESGKSGSASLWKARFAPQEIGTYTCFLRLSRPGKPTRLSPEQTFEVAQAEGKGFLHPNTPWTLRFDSGEKFRGLGENICWESRSKDDSKFFSKLHETPRFNFDHMVDLLTRNGGNFYRVWLCPWSLPLETKHVVDTVRYTDSTERYNPSAIRRLDQLVELSEAKQAYLMLTLSGGWDLDAYSAAQGGPAPTREAFFTDPGARTWYKSRLRYLVGRWGYSPAIAAWEFFNEVDNPIHGPGDKPLVPYADVTRWHTEMSAYLKAIDPYGHLVTTSISHREITGLNDIPSMDINQRHIYRNTDGMSDAIQSSEAKHGKPYVIGEFGYHWDWSLNFNEMADDFDYDYRKGLWFGLFTPTPILPMSWWWEFFEDRGLMPTFSRVRTILDRMLKAGQGSFLSLPASASAPHQKAMAVLCGKTQFAYLLNNTKTEVTTDLSIEIGDQPSAEVTLYFPETGSFKSLGPLTTQAKTITIKDLKLPARTDVVAILEP